MLEFRVWYENEEIVCFTSTVDIARGKTWELRGL
jgi:hypothetical protein